MQVVVELLSYHNTATHEEVAAVTRLADSEAGTLEAQQLAKLVVHRTGLETVAVVRFSYYGPELEDLCKVQKVLVMFTDLFGTEKFDVKCLVSLCCMVCERFQYSQTPRQGSSSLFGRTTARWRTTTGPTASTSPTARTPCSSPAAAPSDRSRWHRR